MSLAIYKAAWFLCHRLHEAMRDDASIDFLGGANQVVEADETYIGKAKNRATRKPVPRKAVLSLIERDGRVRSYHVANVTAETVKSIIAKNADKASVLMTDESPIYGKIGNYVSCKHTQPRVIVRGAETSGHGRGARQTDRGRVEGSLRTGWEFGLGRVEWQPHHPESPTF